MSADTSWIDLLSSRDTINGRLLKVTDNTPKRGQDGRRSKISEVRMLRCQVAALLKDKQRLTEDALKSREGQVLVEAELNNVKEQLKVNQRQSDEVYRVAEEQSRLISELSQVRNQDRLDSSHYNTDVVDRLQNDLSHAQTTIRELEKSAQEKDLALEGVYAHVQELRNEVTQLSSHLQAPHTHSTLLKDMERLTLRNAEVSEGLVATQHSRTLLEKELIAVKKRLTEEKSRSKQLDQLLTLAGERGGGMLGEENMRLQQLLEKQQKVLCAKERELATTTRELVQLKGTQLSTIDAKCREVDVLRTQMVGQLTDVEQERVQLERELQQSHEEVLVLSQQLRQSNDEVSMLSQQLEQSKEQTSVLSQQLEQSKELVSVLSQQLEQSKEQTSVLSQQSGQSKKHVSMLSQQLEQSKDQESVLSQQLDGSNGLCDQLRKEADTLHNRIRQLEGQCQEQCSVADKVKGQLETTSFELDGVLMEVESNRTDKLILKQQVNDLEGQVDSLKAQLASRTELTNEMKALLDQRAARIKQLERANDRQREELSVALETSGDLLNASKDSMGSMTSLSSSVVNSTCSTHKRSPSRFSTAQTEVVHLKQRLAESRQGSIRLELQCAQLKTESARLQGSQQALLTIREQLMAENNSLDRGQRSLRENWDSERDEMTNQIASLHYELNETRGRTFLQESHSVITMETDLNLTKHEVTNLQSELSHVTLDLDHVTVKLDHVISLVDSETTFLHERCRVVSVDVSTLRAEALQVRETTHLTQVVNIKRSTQIEEHETSLSRLLAEVEVLRARKKVVMNFLNDRETGKRSLGDTEGQRSHHHRVMELKSLLKRQKKQTNFVRVRLGYALVELRLYKQLKVAMDTQLHEMQSVSEGLQRQYDSCALRLRQAELLGFGTHQ